jgi:hypothetical protein
LFPKSDNGYILSMKVVIFSIEYRAFELGWGRNPIPRELRSDIRIPLFHELAQLGFDRKASLIVFPGGFFRTDFPAGIAGSLKRIPPKTTVLVGRDNKAGNKLEAWVVAPSGRIRRKIPEAWIHKKESKRQSVLDSISDRRFQHENRLYAVFCCGDVIIDKRRAPITHSKAAFVLAHYSAKGIHFTPSMRSLNIPVFLSHHVKDPYNTVNFAYQGDRNLRPLIPPFKGKSLGFRWIGRIYSI